MKYLYLRNLYDMVFHGNHINSKNGVTGKDVMQTMVLPITVDC